MYDGKLVGGVLTDKRKIIINIIDYTFLSVQLVFRRNCKHDLSVVAKLDLTASSTADCRYVTSGSINDNDVSYS